MFAPAMAAPRSTTKRPRNASSSCWLGLSMVVMTVLLRDVATTTAVVDTDTRRRPSDHRQSNINRVLITPFGTELSARRYPNDVTKGGQLAARTTSMRTLHPAGSGT